MTDDLLLKRLRRNCTWQRAKGTSRDNGYPYCKHVPDCDICQAADRIEADSKRIAELESEIEGIYEDAAGESI